MAHDRDGQFEPTPAQLELEDRLVGQQLVFDDISGDLAVHGEDRTATMRGSDITASGYPAEASPRAASTRTDPVASVEAVVHEPAIRSEAGTEIKFYRVTHDDLIGEPGNLITERYEKTAPDAEATLADASAIYRVLYQSVSGLGDDNAEPTDEPIAVAGLIAFPRGEAPDGEWPVVSWAHGTVGGADHAAPSTDPYVDAELGGTLAC